MFSWCNDLDQMLPCGIRISLLSLSRAPSLTLALWLTSISLVRQTHSFVEIKMKKTDAIRWEKLEGEGQESNIKHFNPNQYPTSSHYTCKWDKMALDISEEEKNEKLEGDAALNKLFQQIYTDGTDDIRRAMNKSFKKRLSCWLCNMLTP
ncbi:Suppressor of G2 allele of SKP1 [Characodon lateralis]|uniref:Suppressor of G2 allele of SKP1 n=1 Tax=Characodon lateralis TaxID=208331 RepID=A0ABU7EUG8_9TELE|nr:Suppressor of G2 allele of SKP1 [Characodon lateralis]